jgi:MFS family permease
LPLVFHIRPLLWALLFMWGAGGGSLYTLGLVRLGELFPPGQLGAATAAFVMITHIGSIAGPVLAGGGMDIWNPHGFVVVTATTALIFVVFGTWRYLTTPDAAHRKRQADPAESPD